MGTKNNPGTYDCYENADPDEPMFILLGRDPDAPTLVDAWAAARERLGEHPAKVAEARTCADTMRTYLGKLGKHARGTEEQFAFERDMLEPLITRWATMHRVKVSSPAIADLIDEFSKVARISTLSIWGVPPERRCPECGGDFYDGRQHAPTVCNNSTPAG